MFCTSLRRRKEWATAAPVLLQYDKFKFRENKMDTHDVNLPLPSAQPGQRYLRFVLLSSANQDSTYRHQRVERLHSMTGGADAAILWLLDQGGDAASLLQFQIELVDTLDLPLVPLQQIEELPTTLLKFHRSFLQADASKQQRPAQAPGSDAVQTLLRYAAIAPPLGEHSINILSDLTVGFADLANKAQSEAGRAEILDYLGQEEAERVVMFWMQECLL